MCYGSLHLTCYVDETLHCNIYMDGTMCMDGTCLCMNNVYGWNWCDMWYETYVLDMCWICDMKLMCWICDIYLLSYIIAVKIVGVKKQKKETICRIFAVCHRRQRDLCHQQRTAKRPPGRQLCFLGGWPIWSVCQQWLTAKALPSAADGKGLPLTT